MSNTLALFYDSKCNDGYIYQKNKWLKCSNLRLPIIKKINCVSYSYEQKTAYTAMQLVWGEFRRNEKGIKKRSAPYTISEHGQLLNGREIMILM